MDIAEARQIHGFERSIPATLDAVDRVCSEIRTFLIRHQWGDQLFRVELLAREALVNAVVHGCRSDPTQSVRIGIEAGHILVLEVEDPGPGFDWSCGLVNGSVNPSEDHGRGIAIFESYADGVTYNNKGNRVTLRVSPARQEATYE